METVYRTLDGKIFRDSADAAMYEQQILAQVKMWNWDKNPTNDTSQARVIHLIGAQAGAIFKAMVAANEFETDEISDSDIDDDDTGWFYWDEFQECYCCIDDEIIDTIIAANCASTKN